MINAIVQNKNGDTLVAELPCGKYELYAQLASIGVRNPPSTIMLTDEEDQPVQVKLYSESEFGNHLIRLLTERHTLADADTLAFIVANVPDELKELLEEYIINDQYRSPIELFDDVRQLVHDIGTVTESYYFPLSAVLDDGESGEYIEVSQEWINNAANEFGALLDREQSPEDADMAQYMNAHPGVKAKLVSAVWDAEFKGGDLYGVVRARLREPFTGEERAAFKEEIRGQAADGFGEHIEQRPIETENGDLYISMWQSGESYFVYDESEIDEFLARNQQMKLGSSKGKDDQGQTGGMKGYE